MPANYNDKTKKWDVQFYYVDWTGVNKKKHKRGFKLKREAEAWEREFLLKSAGNPEMTFSSLVDLYFSDAENRIRKSTIETKKNMIKKHLLPYFKDKVVSEITKTDIRNWQNEMLAKINPKTGEPYEATYLRSINSQLSAILRYAVEYYKLPSNPCATVKAIGSKRADEMSFWTLDQFNQFISCEERKIYHLAFMMLYWTGMRCGELLALTPSNIMHKEKSIKISHTFKREDEEYVLGDPKTSNSYRIVSLPDFLYDELMGYMNAVYEISPGERIFYMTKHGLRSEMQRVADAAGLECIRIHDLRHSHVALLIELKYGTHAIADRIGDTPEEVNRTYAHLYPTAARDLANDLNRHKDGIVRPKEDE